MEASVRPDAGPSAAAEGRLAGRRVDRLAKHFLLMARANRLANHRLHAACLRLTHDEWRAPRTGFFPSIAATLDHVLIVDRYYLDALEEGGLGASLFAARTPCATMEATGREQRAVDERLIDFCAGLDDESLARQVAFDRGARGRPLDRIDRTLGHLFLHQTHHRGQAHAMLSGTSVAPPQLDEFLMATDAIYRVDDLQAVAMTEDDLTP